MSATPPSEAGPCRYCGKPGKLVVSRVHGLVHQCAPCEAAHPGFTLHFGYLVLGVFLAAALAGWWLWR